MNKNDEYAKRVYALSVTSVSALSLTCQAQRHFYFVFQPLNKAKHSLLH